MELFQPKGPAISLIEDLYIAHLLPQLSSTEPDFWLGIMRYDASWAWIDSTDGSAEIESAVRPLELGDAECAGPGDGTRAVAAECDSLKSVICIASGPLARKKREVAKSKQLGCNH